LKILRKCHNRIKVSKALDKKTGIVWHLLHLKGLEQG